MLYLAESNSSGLGAFQVSLKALVFQLVTFLLVLLIFKRWILPPINKTLNQRRKTLEESLEQAKLTKQKLEAAEAKAEQLISAGRENADRVLREAKDEAKQVVAQAEAAAREQADRVLGENHAQLAQAKNRLSAELKEELTSLVVDTTEKVLRQKVSAQADMELIKRTVKEIK